MKVSHSIVSSAMKHNFNDDPPETFVKESNSIFVCQNHHVLKNFRERLPRFVYLFTFSFNYCPYSGIYYIYNT